MKSEIHNLTKPGTASETTLDNTVAMPKVTVVTAVLNGIATIEKSIQSVLDQTYSNIEYIIVDGGSTDGTKEVIEGFGSRICKWVSEPDKGIYDGMNKGLKLATGDYIMILNADDFLVPNAIERSVRAVLESGADYSVGSIRFLESSMLAAPIFPIREGYVYQEMLYPHIGAMISSEAYRKVGRFDCRYRIAADFDMALRIHLAGFRACLVEGDVIGLVSEGGISSNFRTNREFFTIARVHGKPFLMAWLTYVKQIVKLWIFKNTPLPLIKIIMKLKRGRYGFDAGI